MNIESIREYCLSLPLATEDMPFDETVLVFRLKGKIFASLMLDKPDIIVMKCDAERALDLRDRYESVEPAWHWNKKYWNQIHIDGDVERPHMEELLRHAYNEVNINPNFLFPLFWGSPIWLSASHIGKSEYLACFQNSVYLQSFGNKLCQIQAT